MLGKTGGAAGDGRPFDDLDGSRTGRAGPGEVFFDARRGIYYARPVLRGWLHLVWFGLSVVAGPLLLARAHGAQRITAGAIYVTSVSALFGVSAAYHRGRHLDPRRRGTGRAGPGRRPALYRRGAVLPPSPARPVPRRCSATTRSSTPSSAWPRPASTPRSPS